MQHRRYWQRFPFRQLTFILILAVVISGLPPWTAARPSPGRASLLASLLERALTQAAAAAEETVFTPVAEIAAEETPQEETPQEEPSQEGAPGEGTVQGEVTPLAVSAPVITEPSSPTNLSSLYISGYGPQNARISLYYSVDGGEKQLAGFYDTSSSTQWRVMVELPSEGTYTFTAVAVVDGETSPESEPVVLVVDWTPPAAPTDLSVTAVDDETLLVRWTPPPDSDVVSYEVYRNGTRLYSGDDTDLWHVDRNLNPSTTATYTVRSRDLAGNTGPESEPVSGTTLPSSFSVSLELADLSLSRTEGNDDSGSPAVSADGRFVAFASYATNLVEGVLTTYRQIYLRDLQTGTTELVSVGLDGEPADGYCYDPSVSGDGRYVVFRSGASNLVSGVSGAHIYVRDRLTGTTALVDVAPEGVPSGYSSDHPAISADGRHVVFRAELSGVYQIFVRDLEAGTTAFISARDDGTYGYNGNESPSISADGRYVAFRSFDQLVPEDPDSWGDIYVHDRDADGNGIYDEEGGTAKYRITDYSAMPGYAEEPAISGDGRYVVFRFSPAWVDGNPPTIAGGLYLYDRASGTLERVSYTYDGVEVLSDQLYNPVLSHDGRYVAFWEEGEEKENVYLLDRQGGAPMRYSRGPAGQQPNGGSEMPAISADGSVVAFESSATNLLTMRTSGRTHIFVARPGDAAPPVWPEGATLTATDVGGSYVTLTWSAATDDVGVSGYRIRDEGGVVATVGGGSTTHTLTGLIPEATYTFTVEAGDAAGNWTAGPSVTVTTTSGAGLLATAEPGGIVRLTWDPAGLPGLSAYRVYRAAGDGPPTLLAEVGPEVTTYVDSGLAAETTYTYRITTVVEGAGEAEYTDAATVTTPPLSLSRFAWGADRRGSLAMLGGDLVLVLEGEPNRSAEAVITYEAWDPSDSTLGTASATVALTEWPAGSGTYRGVWTLESGTATVTGIAGSLSDGAGHVISQEATGLPLEVSGALAVTIDVAELAALEGSTVTASSASRSSAASAPVSADGLVVLGGLAAAEDYRLEVRGPQGQVLAVQSGIAIRAGMEEALTVTPAVPASVQAQVLTEEGSPLPGVRVVFSLAGGTVIASGFTDAQGYTPVLSRLQSGQEVQARIAQADLPYQQGTADGVTLQGGNNLITLVAQRMAEGTLTGTVTVEGTPLEGVRVTATQQLGGRLHTASAVTDAEGRYALTLFAGDASVSAASQPDPVYLTRSSEKVSIPAGGSAELNLALDTYGPGEVDLIIHTRLVGGEWTTLTIDGAVAYHYYPRVTTETGTFSRGYPVRIWARGGEEVEVCIDGREAQLPKACTQVVLDEVRRGTAEFWLEQGGVITGRVQGLPEPDSQWSGTVWQVDPATGELTVVGGVRGAGPELRTVVPEAGEYRISLSHRSGLHQETIYWTGRFGELHSRTAWVWAHDLRGEVSVTVPYDEEVDVGEIPLVGDGPFAGRPGNGVTAVTPMVPPGGVGTGRVELTNRSDLMSWRDETGLPYCGVFATPVISLPPGVTLVEGSVTLDGAPVTPTVHASGFYVESVLLEPEQRAVLTYQFRVDPAYEESVVDADVRVHWTCDVQDRNGTDLLGSIRTGVEQVSLEAPRWLASPVTTLRGMAPPGAAVQVYDGAVLLGEVTASVAGTWMMPVELVDRPTPAWHQLQARIQTASGVRHSDPVQVLHDPSIVVPTGVTVRQDGGRTTTFNPQHGVAKFPFVFVPGQKFEYEIAFTDPDLVRDVVVWMGDHSAVATRGPDGLYRAEMAVAKPGPIGIEFRRAYANPLGTPVPTEEELRRRLPELMSDFVVESATGDAESGQVDFRLPQLENMAASVAVQVSRNVSYTPTPEEAERAAATGLPVYGLEFAIDDSGESLEVTVSGMLPESLLETVGVEGSVALISQAMAAGPEVTGMGTVAMVQPANLGQMAKVVYQFVIQNKQLLDDLLGEVLNLVELENNLFTFLDGAFNGTTPAEELQNLLDIVDASCDPTWSQYYYDKIMDLVWYRLVIDLMQAAAGIAGVVLGATGVGLIGTVALFAAGQAINWALDEFFDAMVDVIRDDIMDNPRCDASEWKQGDGKPGRKPRRPGADPTFIYDPSGFVYEGMPGNRVEGVTATVTYYDEASASWVVWDAEWFGYENPQRTDAAGRYGWDVPPGQWQVIYEKAGYDTAYSDVLPVPPPHFDVNIDLQRLDAPVVTGAYARPDGSGIVVRFNQYMAAGSLGDGAIAAADELGAAVAGSASAAESAVAPDGDTLSREAVFTPVEPLVAGQTYTVTVGQAALAYTGLPLAEVTQVAVTVPAVDEVSDLAVTPGDGRLTVTWTDPAEGADHLRVYVRRAAAPVWTGPVQVGVGIGQYTLTGLENGAAYEVLVSAVDGSGVETPGVVVTGVPQVVEEEPPPDDGTPPGGGKPPGGGPPPPPKPPRDLPPGPPPQIRVRPGDRSVEVTWTDPDDEDLAVILLSWQAEGSDAPDGGVEVEPGVEAYTIEGLTNGVRYTIRLITVDAGGHAAGPALVYATPVDAEPPGPVSEVRVEGGPGSVTLTWVDPPDGDLAAVEVQWGDGQSASVAPGTQRFTITGLSDGVAYPVQIEAVDDDGNRSEAVSVTAAPDVSQEVHEVGPAGGAVEAFDGSLMLEVPEGAFPEGAVLTIRRLAAAAVPDRPGLVPAAPLWEIEVGGGGPQAPVRLAIRYTDGPQDLRTLGVYREEEGSWRYVGGVLDREGGRLWVTLDGFSRYTAFGYHRTFADLEGHWAQEAVAVLAARHLVDGVSADAFEPDRPITRAEMATLLVRMLGAGPYAPARPTFADVRPGAWYYGWVERAALLGLVQGSEGRFRPDDLVSRQEMATMVIRAMGLEGEAAAHAGDPLPFRDADQIAPWARGYVALAYSLGLLRGVGKTRIDPTGPATRAQAAALLLRGMEQLGLIEMAERETPEP